VVACWTVALADLCGWVQALSGVGVGVSCVACVRLRLASALCLSAPMLLGVSLVPLCNDLIFGPIHRWSWATSTPRFSCANCECANVAVLWLWQSSAGIPNGKAGEIPFLKQI
jgi:hypothetical protein